jgi:hypothetical protein
MADLQRALERRLDARGAEDDCGRPSWVISGHSTRWHHPGMTTHHLDMTTSATATE